MVCKHGCRGNNEIINNQQSDPIERRLKIQAIEMVQVDLNDRK